MTRRLTLVILLTALLMGNGCARALMNLSSSSFLSNFSLEELVKKNRSPSGLLCGSGGLGGMGGGGSSFSRAGYGQSSSHKSSSFSCQIKSTGESSFDEADFLASLKADVEKEIADSAKVADQGTTGQTGFYFEYVEHDIRGRIEISGKSSPPFYTLEAKLVESSGASQEKL
jgi:hypothetical protein